MLESSRTIILILSVLYRMGSVSTWWRSLERWSATLFLIAGGVLIVYAALTGLEAFLDITVEQKGLEVGHVIGFLGLLGLYPTLADRRPWLARAGAVAAILGVVAFSVFTFVCRY
jgi:protein-S-isoprenylcysteine O-methyltransferase Ste14